MLSDFKRFIVLSRSRTGSNMLISLLNSHPHIDVEGEIFAKLEGQNYQDILSRVYSEQPRHIKAKGFKIFYYHPQDDKSQGIWSYLEESKHISVVHLKRRNTLRTLISRKIADSCGVWATRSSVNLDIKEKKSLIYTSAELEKGFRQTKAWEIENDVKFSSHPLISIYYEDILDDSHNQFRYILDFLQVPFFSLKTEMKKQNPENMRDLVINYDELKFYFQETEWQEFFEE